MSTLQFAGLLLALLFSVARFPAPFQTDLYEARILAQRQKRDREFRSREWSPLAVVALARLDRPRTVIGSAPDADLQLKAPEVEPHHTEVIRQVDQEGKHQWYLRPLDGKVLLDGSPGSARFKLEKGSRMRIGRLIVYFDYLGTLGAVLRGLDFSSPAYAEFKGLNYYPPDRRYRIETDITPYPSMTRIEVLDTAGWIRPAWRYGEACFNLDGKSLRLVIWLFTDAPKPSDRFFVAFADATSGKETYPAGRYLEIPFVKSGRTIVDFNEAYNPSCAYNKGFACPLPPASNRLPVSIPAGEKIYRKD